MVSREQIVIVGAGIIGLDTALVLCERGLGPCITVIAEHMPGDTSTNYTSPWAGCNFSAISGTEANALRWDRAGYAHLTKLASKCPEASFVERTSSTEFWDEMVPHDKIKNMSEYLENFRAIPSKELPPGMKYGISFTALTINAPKHCEYLYKLLLNTYGVSFIRRKLPSLDAAYRPSTSIVLNCTGVAAKTLPGVQDDKVFPTRGQVVLVKAPRVKNITMVHGKDYESYIIPRPGSNGNVVLGGYMQKGVSDGSTYSSETESILARTRKIDADLRDHEHEVLASFAGLRPSRIGGARIEKVATHVNGHRKILVHNYGAGGTGFQAGWGMALDAVKTIEDDIALLDIKPKL